MHDSLTMYTESSYRIYSDKENTIIMSKNSSWTVKFGQCWRLSSTTPLVAGKSRNRYLWWLTPVSVRSTMTKNGGCTERHVTSYSEKQRRRNVFSMYTYTAVMFLNVCTCALPYISFFLFLLLWVTSGGRLERCICFALYMAAHFPWLRFSTGSIQSRMHPRSGHIV